MNWKVIVGALIIFGAVGESIAEMKDYNTGVTTFNPAPTQIICGLFACAGVYLIYKGRQKKKPGL